MRLGDQALVFQSSHVVSDGRWAHAEGMPLDK
jgi:hypothetical protein